MKTKQRKLEGQGGVFQRIRLRKAQSGKKHGMKGVHHVEATKQKMRGPRPSMTKKCLGKTGEKHNGWKGGSEASKKRSEQKRRGFGFIPINKNFIGAEAHHLDTHFVLYIPKVLHRSVYHNVMTGQGMKEINDLAIRSIYGEHEESRWSI